MNIVMYLLILKKICKWYKKVRYYLSYYLKYLFFKKW